MLRQSSWPVIVAAFISGFIIMGVELLGGRILAPYFGGSIHVWGSLITVFMLALSLGYLLGGKWSLHQPSRQRMAVLFAVSALLLSPLLFFSSEILKWLFLTITDPRYGALASATALFLLPTITLGMISPYAVRLLTRDHNTTGMTAGTLYFVSTIGSAAGTIVTSFYLVLWFSVSHILIGFSSVLLLTAALLFYRIEESK
ncbi:MAG: glycosyl transferase [Gammaproteobacteria bacterium]|nr:MAG: glycosyl transferase [Gammaproteobacteria bacterium]